MLFRFLGRGQVSFSLGVRVDLLDWRFRTCTLSPTSPGHEAGEGFLKQAMPIPVPGLEVRVPLAAGLEWVSGIRGFRANHWDSGRDEGGRIYFSQTYLDANAGLVWRPAPEVQLMAGYRCLFLDLDEVSEEDWNRVSLLAQGVQLGLQVAF